MYMNWAPYSKFIFLIILTCQFQCQSQWNVFCCNILMWKILFKTLCIFWSVWMNYFQQNSYGNKHSYPGCGIFFEMARFLLNFRLIGLYNLLSDFKFFIVNLFKYLLIKHNAVDTIFRPSIFIEGFWSRLNFHEKKSIQFQHFLKLPINITCSSWECNMKFSNESGHYRNKSVKRLKGMQTPVK